jgi:hypothetical protein
VKITHVAEIRKSRARWPAAGSAIVGSRQTRYSEALASSKRHSFARVRACKILNSVDGGSYMLRGGKLVVARLDSLDRFVWAVNVGWAVIKASSLSQDVFRRWRFAKANAVEAEGKACQLLLPNTIVGRRALLSLLVLPHMKWVPWPEFVQPRCAGFFYFHLHKQLL